MVLKNIMPVFYGFQGDYDGFSCFSERLCLVQRKIIPGFYIFEGGYAGF